MKRPVIVTAIVVVLLLITLPFVMVALLGGQDYVFTGFLVNPWDLASYQAKMYQGWAGSWRFVLPYTAEPGEGAYIFLYYLFLGHVARLTGLPLVVMLHLARVLGALMLLLAVAGLYQHIFRDRPDLFKLAYWLTVAGAGMGWLTIFFGHIPSDFWVAEAYPFLSMYTNPHFPLGLACMVWAFSLTLAGRTRFQPLWLALLGLAIATVFPFALVVTLLVIGLWTALTWRQTRRLDWVPLVSTGSLGGPYLLYQFWVTQADPILAGWNAQNLTLTPPLWDIFLSFSPALILAIFGVRQLWCNRASAAWRLLVPWLLAGLALIYVPVSIQRRFMLGFYIPAGALAAYGVDYLRHRFPGSTRRLVLIVFLLAIPSNGLTLVSSLFLAAGNSPLLYLTRDEAQALRWIGEETPRDALVLASPEIGRMVPGWNGRRVIYGHPYETVHAEAEEQRVRDFYAAEGRVDPETGLLRERSVDYVFYGPREKELGGRLDFSALDLVFDSGQVQVYQVGP